VGLTGGLASGKSTVAEILAQHGAEIFDCDAYVHELYLPDGAGARDVAYLFGDEVLDPEGGVDRSLLASRVLDDESARHRLEGAIHPLVRTGIAAWLADLDPRSVAVIEAALLVETGSWRDYELLAVVWCGIEQQLDRASARGVPADRARSLIAAQRPLAEKTEQADVVIDNSGPREALDAEVERAWFEILARCEQRAAEKPSPTRPPGR
jgi:dephospho-CoA kinase